MVKISPSMLASDYTKMGEELKSVTEAGADLVHLDIMDGMFVPNISFGMDVVRALRPVSGILFDVHLMIEAPARYITRFAEAGADIITVHAEACRDITVALDTIRLNGKLAGLSVKPGTPIDVIYPYLEKCDLVLIMTVEPGYGGQKLIPEMIEKIRLLREELCRRGLTMVQISVDGGVTPENAGELIHAGADILVAGSSVFRSADRRAAIEALRA